MLDHASSLLKRYFARAICRIRINNNNLIGNSANGVNTTTDVPFLVLSDDNGANLYHEGDAINPKFLLNYGSYQK